MAMATRRWRWRWRRTVSSGGDVPRSQRGDEGGVHGVRSSRVCARTCARVCVLCARVRARVAVRVRACACVRACAPPSLSPLRARALLLRRLLLAPVGGLCSLRCFTLSCRCCAAAAAALLLHGGATASGVARPSLSSSSSSSSLSLSHSPPTRAWPLRSCPPTAPRRRGAAGGQAAAAGRGPHLRWRCARCARCRWSSYESGVFTRACGADVDHAIVLEGYGTDSATGLDYYLVSVVCACLCVWLSSTRRHCQWSFGTGGCEASAG